jgi:hypothetical protein
MGEAAGAERAWPAKVRAELGAMLRGNRPSSRSRKPAEGAELAMAGGLSALLVAKVNAGEGERLGELEPELVELVLTPYIGHEKGAAEADAARG